MVEGVLLKLEGQVVEVLDKPNRNGRIYTKELFENNVLNDKIVNEKLLTHSLFGEFEPSYSGCCIDASRISHSVSKLYIEDDKVKADIDILDTSQGQLLLKAINNGCSIHPVLVGRGDVITDSDGNEIVADNYELDIIAMVIGKF